MIDKLTEKLLASRNYRDVCPSTIERAVKDSVMRYPKAKEAEKAARERLHGITSAFMTEQEAKAALALSKEVLDDDVALEKLLSRHVSTRERLPLAHTDELFTRFFSKTGMPGRVLDLACGLNPVYLAARYGFEVLGTDISGMCVRIINEGIGSPHVRAECRDLLDELPEGHFDVALLFKVLPLLERQEKGAADRLLAAISADYIIVSFPLKTMGGRSVGMHIRYTEWMDAHMPKDRETIDIFEDNGRELYRILKKSE